jgi:predicted N-formylglutamate amidohydrolase
MTYKEAFEYCLSHIGQRIDEMGEIARENKEDDMHAAARNFQNGLIECRDLIEKTGMLAKWAEKQTPS